MLSSYPKYKYNYIFNNKLNWKSDRCRIVGYFYPLQGVQTFNILRKQSQHFIEHCANFSPNQSNLYSETVKH